MFIYSYRNVFKSKGLCDKLGSSNLVVYMFEANKNYCKTNEMKCLNINLLKPSGFSPFHQV